MKTLKSKLNDCILITYCINSKSLQCTKAKWSNLSWAQLAVSFYFRKIVICMRLFTGFSSFKTLISPPTQEWKTQSLYCCTCATLYVHTACVTSLQFPTMSRRISYLKFTGAYVWVCPVGTNSATVEEQETAETGPTKHRQMTRQEWGGGLAHFVFQFHQAWPPRHGLATGLRIVVDEGSAGSFFFGFF